MLLFDDPYEPDEILMDIEGFDDDGEYPNEIQEIDFERPDITKASIDDFFSNSEIHETFLN